MGNSVPVWVWGVTVISLLGCLGRLPRDTNNGDQSHASFQSPLGFHVHNRQ